MVPAWIDAHCHLTDLRVFSRVEALIRQAEEQGIGHWILGGVEPTEWERQKELHERYPSKFSMVFGLHPWWVDEQILKSKFRPETELQIQAALDLLRKEASTLVGVGELGLDWSQERKPRSGESQLWVFQEQIDIANKASKPIVLHIVRAHAEALSILKRRAPFHGGIVHSFSGSWIEAQAYLELGFFLSISARVTYPQADRLHEVVKKAPIEQLVFETDVPDQAPFGYQGRIHGPGTLLKVAQAVAQLRGNETQTLLEQSRQNLVRAFQIQL